MNKVIFEMKPSKMLSTKEEGASSPPKHKHFGKVPTYIEKFHKQKED